MPVPVTLAACPVSRACCGRSGNRRGGVPARQGPRRGHAEERACLGLLAYAEADLPASACGGEGFWGHGRGLTRWAAKNVSRSLCAEGIARIDCFSDSVKSRPPYEFFVSTLHHLFRALAHYVVDLADRMCLHPEDFQHRA